MLLKDLRNCIKTYFLFYIISTSNQPQATCKTAAERILNAEINLKIAVIHFKTKL